MNTKAISTVKKEEASRRYIQRRRPDVRMSARKAYGLCRIFLVLYGGIIAAGFFLSPFKGRTLVPDFALDIFMAILAILALSEIVLRMTEYSCETYALAQEKEGMDCENGKDPFLIRLAFWVFPFRGIHIGLMILWFFLAVYYLLICGIGIGENAVVCPENFLASFYAVAAACVFDFLSKGLFIFRIPGLAGLVAEFAETAIRSEGRMAARILEGFLKILPKMPLRKA